MIKWEKREDFPSMKASTSAMRQEKRVAMSCVVARRSALLVAELMATASIEAWWGTILHRKGVQGYSAAHGRGNWRSYHGKRVRSKVNRYTTAFSHGFLGFEINNHLDSDRTHALV